MAQVVVDMGGTVMLTEYDSNGSKIKMKIPKE
jgi:hypothetical protein